MRHILFFALMLMGQVAAPAQSYKGILVQPPYMCGAKYTTRALRVAVLGNSLAWSPPQPAFDWAQSNGMAASSLQSDYAHIVCEALAERRRQTVALLVVQAWGIEAAIDSGGQWDKSYAEVIGNFKPDILAVQFSDNVIKAQPEQFAAAYSEVLDAMHPRQFLLCVGPWYDFAQALAESVRAGCVAHGGAYVAIGDLFTGEDMRGSSFDDTINGGVGSHPNDLGHAEIARRVVNAIEQ